MADFNTAGLNALTQPVIKIAWIAWLDIVGDVQRVTTAPYPLTFGGTGDADLDGFTFGAISSVVSISDVSNEQGGSGSVTVYLSGLPGIDTTTLNQIGTKSNWQGRTARLWMAILDPDSNALISVAPYYTGFMMSPRIAGSEATQTIALEIESYLASQSEASGRTYLDQKYFDSGDNSAAATLACANGTTALGTSIAGNSLSGGIGQALANLAGLKLK